MLVLSRKLEEGVRVRIGDQSCIIHILEIRHDRVRLGFDAEKDVEILRTELIAEQEKGDPK